MGLRKIPPVVQPAQLLEAVVVGLTGEIIQRITEEVDVAPLPGGIGQHLGEGFFEPRVIVGDDELNAAKTPVLQANKEVFPGRLTLTRGEIDAQDFPASALIDTDRDQDRLGPDHTAFTHLLVAGIENKIRVGFVVTARHREMATV